MSEVAVVIPAYGLVEMSQAVVRDCLRESELVDVYVVDNMGDYKPVGDETVLRPGRNLGWLRGTNHGLQAALSHGGYRHLVALNNDTRLTADFFAGLRDAAAAVDQVGLVAPCYDDQAVAAQHAYYRGPLEGFTPESREVETPLIDGTAYLVPTEVYARLGPLDEKHFGQRGWGAIEDYCLRARDAGLKVVVTRRSYLQHARGSTAHVAEAAYERYALAEFRTGMRRKWGKDWRARFPAGTVPPLTSRDRVQDLVRRTEDALGLSKTRLAERHARWKPK